MAAGRGLGVTVAVVLSTYNQPAYLRLALEGYACQTRRPDRIVVADDGSGPDTAVVLDIAAAELGLRILHVRHADRGFRKTTILNRAVRAVDEDVLIFSDGDCIPRSDFVLGHLDLTREGRFISGGYLKLPASTSAEVTADAVSEGRVFDPRWLEDRGWRPGRRALRLMAPGLGPNLLDRLTPTRPTWNGHNASTLRRHLVDANGFDLDMVWGGEDRALGERLVNAGLRGIQARHRLPVVHLDHGRPYVDLVAVARNREIRARIRRERETRAREGIAELPSDPEVVLRELAGGGGRTVVQTRRIDGASDES